MLLSTLVTLQECMQDRWYPSQLASGTASSILCLFDEVCCVQGRYIDLEKSDWMITVTVACCPRGGYMLSS